MSRHTFSSDDFQIDIGVDNFFSTFIVVYDLNLDDDDPLLDADNRGVFYASKHLNKKQKKACKRLKKDMETMVKAGVPYPSISPRHISSIAQAFGVDIQPAKIHQILD